MCPMVSPVPEVSTLILPAAMRMAQVSPVLPGCLGAMPCSCGAGVGVCAGPVYVRGGDGLGVGVGVGVGLQQPSLGLYFSIRFFCASFASSGSFFIIFSAQSKSSVWSSY